SAAENVAATNSGSFGDYDDAVTISASSGTVTQAGSHSGTWSWSGAGDEDSPYSVLITATNVDGSTATTTFDVSFTDVPPVVAADHPSVTFDEGQTATNTGTFADYDDAVTITASEGFVTQSAIQSGGWTWSQPYEDNGSHTITITATNADGSAANSTFTVTINNVAPSNLTLATTTAHEGQSTALSASFLDPGTADTHSVVID